MVPEIVMALLSNPVAGGIIGGSAVVSFFWAVFKGLPQKVWHLFVHHFTVQLVMTDETPDGRTLLFNVGRALYKAIPESRRLRLWQKARDLYNPVPGPWFFKYNKRWMLAIPERIERDGRAPEEKITLYTYGRNITPLKDFVLESLPEVREKTTNTVYTQALVGGWIGRERDLRKIEELVLMPEQKDELVQEIRDFKGSEDFYKKRGIPYQKGILLEGPPGTGKSTLALALAKEFGGQCGTARFTLKGQTDSSFRIAWQNRLDSAPTVIFDDIDTVKAVHRRDNKDVDSHPDPNKEPVTLNTLLDILDGSFGYMPGTLIILTTNHPEKLDPAIVRDGRVDLRMHIGEFEKPQILEMCNKFLEDKAWASKFASTIEAPANPATLQLKLMRESKKESRLKRVTLEPEKSPPPAPRIVEKAEEPYEKHVRRKASR